MRILHTSDWHVGRTLHRADLMPAFELWCRHVVEVVRENEVDAVLVSGDVYDRGVPPTAAVGLVDRTLAELAGLATVVVTAGNHDSPQRLGFGAALMRENVHIRTDALSSGVPVEVRGSDGRLGALVYPIPYLDPDVERTRLAAAEEVDTAADAAALHAAPVPHARAGVSASARSGPATRAGAAGSAHGDAEREDGAGALPRSHEAVLGAALDLVSRDVRHGAHAGEEVARIAMAHAFVTGGDASDSERDIAVGGLASVPSALFRLGGPGPGPLSYVALGHLHSPQRVGRAGDPPMRYSGSPVAFSFSETAPKSSVLLHVHGSAVEPELIPAPVWRPVLTVEGTLEQIEAAALTADAEAFVRAVVIDPDRPAEMAERIRRAFPHALEIQHRAASGGGAHRRADVAAMDPVRVLDLFMSSAGNRPLDAAESALLADAWESALAASNREARS